MSYEYKKNILIQSLAFVLGINRKRGDGSFVRDHLQWVACKLDEHNAPLWAVVVARLHDSVEDGDLALSQVWRKFGFCIALGVLVVTKQAWLSNVGFTGNAVMWLHLKLIGFSTLFTPWLAALKMADRTHNVHPSHRHPNWSDGNYRAYTEEAIDIFNRFGSSNEQIASTLGDTINEALESLGALNTAQNKTPAFRAC